MLSKFSLMFYMGTIQSAVFRLGGDLYICLPGKSNGVGFSDVPDGTRCCFHRSLKKKRSLWTLVLWHLIKR